MFHLHLRPKGSRGSNMWKNVTLAYLFCSSLCSVTFLFLQAWFMLNTLMCLGGPSARCVWTKRSSPAERAAGLLHSSQAITGECQLCASLVYIVVRLRRMEAVDCCSCPEEDFVVSCVWPSVHLLNVEDVAEAVTTVIHVWSWTDAHQVARQGRSGEIENHSEVQNRDMILEMRGNSFNTFNVKSCLCITSSDEHQRGILSLLQGSIL